MTIVKDGYPFILGSLAVALAVWYGAGIIWCIPFLVLTAYFAYFFRNPKRVTEQDGSVIYSPADGTVMGVEDFYDEEYLNEEAVKVTIFLSVFNVHVNRSPVSGEIKYQRYTCGQFVPAYEKNASFENERHAIGVENDKMKVLVIQVAGLLARRIVSWVTLGHNLTQGECYGMIKFGSSTELVLPKNVEILVKKGDAVTGGKSIIGRVMD
jgi:phosphatidylserine decarboxylase